MFRQFYCKVFFHQNSENGSISKPAFIFCDISAITFENK